MLRIVGIQPSDLEGMEFVLLQNQGHMRTTLRGHMLMSDMAFSGGQVDSCSHAFPDEEVIGPGLFVMLSTGVGTPHWGRTKDGAHIFHTYMNRNAPVWMHCPGPLHVMNVQHTYVDRSSRIEYLFAK